MRSRSAASAAPPFGGAHEPGAAAASRTRASYPNLGRFARDRRMAGQNSGLSTQSPVFMSDT